VPNPAALEGGAVEGVQAAAMTPSVASADSRRNRRLVLSARPFGVRLSASTG